VPEIEGCCGSIDPAMSEDDVVVAAAERFRALADPTRVRMLNLLVRNDELCACDTNANFDLSQPTVSHHLGILRNAGLVDVDVRGR
jgi:ArsR family transcriptional regulator